MASASCFHLVSSDELLPARWRQPIVAKLAIMVLGHFPSRDKPPIALQAMQRRIQRTMLNLQHIVGGALNVPSDLTAMTRAKQQRSQDQHIERPLQEGDTIRRWLGHGVSRMSTITIADTLLSKCSVVEDPRWLCHRIFRPLLATP
jgi:hypothetical protein